MILFSLLRNLFAALIKVFVREAPQEAGSIPEPADPPVAADRPAAGDLELSREDAERLAKVEEQLGWLQERLAVPPRGSAPVDPRALAGAATLSPATPCNWLGLPA